MLMIAGTASMIDQFNIDNIKLLLSLGVKVDVAFNTKEGHTCTEEEVERLHQWLEKENIPFYQIDFSRSVKDISGDRIAYKQVYELLKNKHYDFVHVHMPIVAAIVRLAAHRTKTKVVYTAHGFHFFKGAPVKNWILYYPVEKFLSRWTDTLILINHEDFQRAQKSFHAKHIDYIPGVGVNTKRFENIRISKEDKRKELGIPLDSFVLLSVGELNSRKNHQVVIKALGELKKEGKLASIIYLIVGRGAERDQYENLINRLGLKKNVWLMGPRDDVDEMCKAADVFVHPSVREGLGIAPLEGMAAGLPLISSYVNGIRDYTEDGVSGCCIRNPLDVNAMKDAITKMQDEGDFRVTCGRNNTETVNKFSIEKSQIEMKRIYREVLG